MWATSLLIPAFDWHDNVVFWFSDCLLLFKQIRNPPGSPGEELLIDSVPWKTGRTVTSLQICAIARLSLAGCNFLKKTGDEEKQWICSKALPLPDVALLMLGTNILFQQCYSRDCHSQKAESSLSPPSCQVEGPGILLGSACCTPHVVGPLIHPRHYKPDSLRTLTARSLLAHLVFSQGADCLSWLPDQHLLLCQRVTTRNWAPAREGELFTQHSWDLLRTSP